MSCKIFFFQITFTFQIDIFSEVAFQLGVDDTSEASLDLALSDLRLKVAKIPSENFQRLRGSENEKVEKLEAIKSLSLSEATLTKAEAEVQSQEVEINQVNFEVLEVFSSEISSCLLFDF